MFYIYPIQMICIRDEDIRIMGQRGEFRGEYRIGVTAGELKDNQTCHKLVTRQAIRFDSVQLLSLFLASKFGSAGIIDAEMRLQIYEKEDIQRKKRKR